MHPMMPSVIYSIMDIKDKSFHCAVDPNSIVDRYAFENMLTVSRIPTVPNQMLYSAGANLPTGFRLPLRDKGILDDTPNATVTMVPFMQGTNFVWIGQTSRIDFIIQTQMAILLVSRVATTVVYFLLLVKFSWTTGRSCFLVLVEYMSLKVTNRSVFDIPVAITLSVKCLLLFLGPGPTTNLLSYVDDLLFIPGPICYIFIVAMCFTKHLLNSCQVSIRLSTVAVYLATILLVTGALTHQGPAATVVRSVDPQTYKPTLTIPMVMLFYRTSPHLDVYYYTVYAASLAIILPPLALQIRRIWQRRRRLRHVQYHGKRSNSSNSSFDLAVGLAIRYPGGFADTNRIYVRGKRAKVPCTALPWLAT
ncbi:hypothetical protein Ae201684_000738 [Aphanomyces euteiches]|nr:hypothetical protein Ae201684_000738 [Aphanomyces euteiches]KAH9147125.1 hypothetical protein AeRB84_009191 [Aphanomyces euteiches]KAH9151880.1 hypothetical protein AeRB84_005605 [Aphanomyces euteiches]